MSVEARRFELPEHPTKGKQCVVVEKPAGSIWYLVVEPNKSVPLVDLENPKSAKDVLDAAGKQNGEAFVMQFVANGFSKLEE